MSGANVRPLRASADGRIRPLPIPPAELALREATRRGWDDGERWGYVHGWRWGWLCGACVGLPGGVGLMWACLQLGLLAGAAP